MALAISHISFSSYAVRRDLNETENLNSLDVVKIITPNVEDKLLKKVERSQLLDLYSMTCVAPFTTAGASRVSFKRVTASNIW